MSMSVRTYNAWPWECDDGNDVVRASGHASEEGTLAGVWSHIHEVHAGTTVVAWVNGVAITGAQALAEVHTDT